MQASAQEQRGELETGREKYSGRWSKEETGTGRKAWSSAHRHTREAWLSAAAAAAAAAGHWASHPAANAHFPPFVPVSVPLSYPASYPVAVLAMEGWEAELPVAVQTLPQMLLCKRAAAHRVCPRTQREGGREGGGEKDGERRE